MTKRELFLDVILSHRNTFYSWGGDDPSGFDCSGLVVEGLKSCGLMARGTDSTAAGLHARFPVVPTPTPGCLAFRYTGPKVTHVEVVLHIINGQVFTIGASGGGSRTTSRDAAMRDNAFIKIRPVWEGAVYADPFLT